MENRKTLRLVKKAMRGNDKAFFELMKVKQKDLLYIAIRIMRNKQDGEDAAQEAALVIRDKIQSLRSPEAFTVWMYKIVHTACMNMKRNMKLSTVDIDELDSQDFLQEDRQEFLPVEYALDKELRDEVLVALDQLPEKQRTCILLFYYEGLKYHEIAEVLETNVQDVANSLGRGKKKLKELLEGTESVFEKPITKQGVGALSVITLILQSDAEEVVTPAMCRAFESGLSAATGIVGGGTSASLGMVKVAASVAVGLAVIAGGVTAFSKMTQYDGGVMPSGSLDGSTAPLKTDDQKQANERSVITESIAQLPLPQNGADESSNERTVGEVFDDFIESDQTEDDWNDFVEATHAQYYTHIVGAQYRFDVYSVLLGADQQPLVIIARVDNNEQVSLAFRQMNEQDIPRQKDIVRAFEEWRK